MESNTIGEASGATIKSVLLSGATDRIVGTGGTTIRFHVHRKKGRRA